MKRAEVWRHAEGWLVGIDHSPDRNGVLRNRAIPDRLYGLDFVTGHPTHAAALAHALAEVGLDRPAEHREAP